MKEVWSPSERRKRSKDCSNPRGFTMKQFCQNQKTKSRPGERTNEAIRQLVREMLLQEKSLYSVLGHDLQVPLPQGVDIDTDKGGGLEYPQDKLTAEFRRDKKRLWNQHADHSYFQDPKKLFVFHYLGHYSYKNSLEDYFPRGSTVPGRVPGIDFPSRNELSCFGGPAKYGGAESVTLRMPFFTFKKRRVTFASVEDAATERLSKATPADIDKHRGSGLPKRPNVYIGYKYIPLDEEEVEKFRSLDEVVIDNWVIDTFYCEEGDVEYAKELGLKYEVL